MLLVKEYPCCDLSKPEKHFYLTSDFNRDNVFYGKTRKLKYKNSNCIFSIKSVLNGSITYAIDGGEKMIEPGEFLVVTKNTSYECYIDSDGFVEDVCIQFTDETIQEVFRSIVSNNRALLDFPFENDSFCLDLKTISFSDQNFLHLLKRIANHNIDDAERDQLKLSLLNYYFCNYYLDQLEKVAFIENENLSTKLEILKRVNSAKDFLHSNYAHPINLQQAAIAACLSQSHLIRKFNEVFRVTPYQYLRALRLRKSIEHLRNTDLPVEQLCYTLGFESPSSFIRAFRETYNTTPGALRKQFKRCPNVNAATCSVI